MERTGWVDGPAVPGPGARCCVAVFLVYPTISTLRMSFDRGLGGNFSRFVGLDNYISLS